MMTDISILITILNSNMCHFPIALLLIAALVQPKLFVFSPYELSQQFLGSIFFTRWYQKQLRQFRYHTLWLNYCTFIQQIGSLQFDTENKDACNEYKKEINKNDDPDSDISPFVIAERGGCSFVTKARNIQKWGGRVAVIVDNQANNNPEHIIMIDDGTGSDILISTILIGNEDGNKLVSFVSKSTSTAHLGLDFSIEAPDDRVEYDIYYSLGDMAGFKVLGDYYKFDNRAWKEGALHSSYIHKERSIPE